MSAEFIASSSIHTDHSGPGRFIWSHVKRHPLVGIALVIGAFSNAALASLVPYFVGNAFNAIIGGEGLQAAVYAGLGIIGAQSLRSVLQLMRNSSAEVFAQRIERDVREELYGSLLGKSMSFHDFQPVGEIMARVTNDVREINLMFNPGINLLIGSGMFLFLPAFSTPLIHPSLALVPILFISSYIFVQYFFVLWLHPIAQNVRSSFGNMNARLAETLDGLQVVKGTAQEDQEVKKFNKLADEVRDYFIQQGDLEARYIPILLLGIAFVGGFWHASFLATRGVIDTGDIVNYLGQLFLFGFPVFVSLTAYSRIALGYASAARILDIINVQTDLDENRAGYSGKLEGRIKFEDVSFGYTAEGAQVLHDISFEVEPGQTVALVGQTGSGKTTVTKLINRTYDTQQGRVLVDGVAVSDWNLASLRSQISIIEQDIFLFSRSIADNIRFGNHDATDAEVVEAAKKAQAHEFIMTFPDGYETVIGQRGVTLSGGQRQRLAIARAFLTDPRILVLDDSTSAIDSATEDRIQKAIWAAAEGRTTLIITHRLSQIRWADHIVVLKQGRVVAQGKHEDLLETSESYRRIFARYETPTKQKTSNEAQA